MEERYNPVEWKYDRMEERYDPMEHGYDPMECKSWLDCIFVQNAPPYIRSGRFCRKTRFKASRVVFWSLPCYKELKLTTNRFTGHTLRGLLIQMQNISLRSSGMRRKENFEIGFGFKSDIAVLTFTFRFLSSLLFLLFLPHFFFSCWGFSRLHFGGKSFKESF